MPKRCVRFRNSAVQDADAVLLLYACSNRPCRRASVMELRRFSTSRPGNAWHNIELAGIGQRQWRAE